ncbi:MAG: hypothetical protein R3E89_08605 [Thiolinea sp.]
MNRNSLDARTEGLEQLYRANTYRLLAACYARRLMPRFWIRSRRWRN